MNDLLIACLTVEFDDTRVIIIIIFHLTYKTMISLK